MALLNALFLIRFLGLGTVTSKDTPFQVKCANSLPGHIQTALWPPPAMQATKLLSELQPLLYRVVCNPLSSNVKVFLLLFNPNEVSIRVHARYGGCSAADTVI